MFEAKRVVRKKTDIIVVDGRGGTHWTAVKTIQPGVIRRVDDLDIPSFLRNRRRVFIQTGKPVSYRAGRGGPLPRFLAERQISQIEERARLKGEGVTVTRRRLPQRQEQSLPGFLARQRNQGQK